MSSEHQERQIPKPVDLSCDLLGARFHNPIILGSGSLDERVDQVNTFLQTNVGAIVPRATRLEYAPGRDVHPSPHLDIQRRARAMRNAEWTGYPIEYWRPHLEELAQSHRVIMSVSGRDIDGCTTVCQELEPYRFPFLELNISCAHSNDAHGFITRNADHITSLIQRIKERGVKTPIAVKLGHSDFIVPLAMKAQEAGADAIVASNTYGPVLDFDISRGEPKLTLGIAGGKGGLSGDPIFHIALTDIADLARHLEIPVIACGGVSTAEHVIKMIMAGAHAVEVYTAAHLKGTKAPDYLNKLVDDVQVWLGKYGYAGVDDVRGRVLPLLDGAHQMKPLKPQLVKDLCVGCQKCVVICNQPGAIGMIFSEKAQTNKVGMIPEVTDACIGCGACVTECPTDALQVIWPCASEW